MTKSQYNPMSGQDMIKLLDKYYGLVIVSQKGSHIKIKLSNNIITIVPNHKELDYGTFSGILKQLEINEKEFFDKIN